VEMASRARMLICLAAGAVCVAASVVRGQFDDASNWSAFDAGEHGVGDSPDGYWGLIFDGRYIYFVPGDDGSDYHGEVLRHDTQGDFNDPESWAAFDPGANGVGINPVGYMGGTFDGRYVYFSPFARGSIYSGVNHGEVLRYDTTGDFGSAPSWTAYDPGSHGVGNDPDGYTDAVFDGRYVYFAPFANGTRYHGEVLRFDTTGDFDAASSWATYEAQMHGVGTNATGYHGAVFDGRYVYFVPSDNSTGSHGEVLRYDTDSDFAVVSSWSAFDAGAHGVGADPDGFTHGVFDGRHVYFVPLWNGSGWHGEFLRYDTTGGFTQVTSWATFDPGENGVGSNADAFAGGAFDGRYIYFGPYGDQQQHGEVLRYDSGLPEPIPTVSEWGMVVLLLLILTAGGVVFEQARSRRTRE